MRNLQDALDDAIRGRRRFTSTCAELEKQLVSEAGDQRAREASSGAQISELEAQIAALKTEKTNAVSAVEKRWRSRRDEDEARHRTEVNGGEGIGNTYHIHVLNGHTKRIGYSFMSDFINPVLQHVYFACSL